MIYSEHIFDNVWILHFFPQLNYFISPKISITRVKDYQEFGIYVICNNNNNNIIAERSSVHNSYICLMYDI